MLDLAEIAAQLGAGLARGAFHDGDDAGYGHDDIPPTRRPRAGWGRCRQCNTLAPPAFAGAPLTQSPRRPFATSDTCTTILLARGMCGGPNTPPNLVRINIFKTQERRWLY